MLTIDKKFIAELKEKNITKIFVYFYEAGCSGKKVNIDTENFEITNLKKLGNIEEIEIFVKSEEKAFFEKASITRTIKADHTGKEKIRFIYNSENVKDRCSCGSSFGFEKKAPKIDFEKLKNLKFQNFQK